MVLEGWKKAGKTALSLGYFLTLLALFAFIAIQGPIVVEKTGVSTESILRDNLFPFGLEDFGLLMNPTFAMVNFGFQIIFGFFSAYLVGRTFQKLFELNTILTLIVTLIFLSPYYSPLVFGIHIINNGYAYPVFLLSVRFLLHGLVFREFSSYMLFFLLSAIAVIMRRQFVFLPVIGITSLIYSLVFDYEEYFGKKIFLILGVVGSILAPDLSERYMNYLKDGRFVSVPFAGLQFAMAPLYVSEAGDAMMFKDNPDLGELFLSIRAPLVTEKLTEQSIGGGENVPLLLRYRPFFENYNKIAYTQIKPIIDSLSNDRPDLVDQGLITISLGLIFKNFGNYALVYLHNIIYYMGGYFLTGFIFLIFVTSFVYHIQYRGRFSLVALMITFIAFSNYILVALLEPVTQEYSFYTDSLIQALLVALVSFLFRSQRGVHRVDENKRNPQNWRYVEKPH